MEQLREWRLGRDDVKTLEVAGRMLGVSAVQMLRYETGERSIPATKALDVSNITGIPPHVLRPDVFPPPAVKHLGGEAPHSHPNEQTAGGGTSIQASSK